MDVLTKVCDPKSKKHQRAINGGFQSLEGEINLKLAYPFTHHLAKISTFVLSYNITYIASE